jgi:hypothetical protein
MNNLTATYEPETGQVILDGHPAGPAGEAALIPEAGLELSFDRIDGHLVRVIADVGDGAAEEETLTRLFGPHAVLIFRDIAAGSTTAPRELSPEPALCTALSQLALLDAARVTSPVPRSSPWWPAQAAVLAEQAGLHTRALAEATQSVRVLAERSLAVPALAVPTARAVASIAAQREPEAAVLLEGMVAAETRRPCNPGLDVAAEVAALEAAEAATLHWVLEPTGLFRPGLSPQSDLLVRHDSATGAVAIDAFLMPGADTAAVDRYQARLVDPAVRRVLAQAPFRTAGQWAHADLRSEYPLDELDEVWIDVVNGPHCPVLGAKTHRTRRALRWADAALRAERAPAGLAPHSRKSDWAALAAIAWERCRRDWEAVGGSRARVTAQPGPDVLAEELGGRY